MIKGIQAIILAAGKSSRFKTDKTKLLEKICGQEIVLYPIKLLLSMHIPITVIVGHQKEQIRETITQHVGDSVSYVIQEEQEGTAHAIAVAQDALHQDHILIMHGDTPLVTSSIIENLYAQHTKTNAALSFVTAHNADPSLDGYARVVIEGNRISIIDDLSDDTSNHCCINAGIYLVKKDFLELVISELELAHADKECSFASIINLARDHNYPVSTTTASFDRVRGINTFQELWAAEQIKRAELIKQWMENGVKFPVAQSVHIDLNVKIGAGSFIGCGVHLLGDTQIGTNCSIHEFSSIENSSINDDSTVFSHCVIKDSQIGSQVRIGPFAHLREHTLIGDNSIIGNFVELKKSSIGAHTKAKHLSYLGDADIGSHVNIGAGTITANHNGLSKQKTSIQDNAYIGVHSSLVAPVTVGSNAFTAAGSVITEDVPSDALAIARARQINKEGYAKKLKHLTPGETPAPSTSFGIAIKTNDDNSTVNE